MYTKDIFQAEARYPCISWSFTKSICLPTTLFFF